MVQHISLPVVVALLLFKTDCLSPSMMKKGVRSHFWFLSLRRNWEVKAPSPPALLMMTKWSAPTRRRLPSTWLVAKLTNLVSVFKLKPGVEKKNVSWLLFIYLFFLLQISDASGSMKVSSVAPVSPFKQAMLSPEECYILDNGVDRTIFVWKGEGSITGSRTFSCCYSPQSDHQFEGQK